MAGEVIVVEICGCCDRQPAQMEHVCPYQSEINDNDEPFCNCCEECSYECAQGV